MTKEFTARIKIVFSMATIGTIGLLAKNIDMPSGLYAFCRAFIAHLPGQEGAILSYIDPLTAVLVSVIFLHEPMSVLQITGAILLLGFTLGNELNFKKEIENDK